MTPLSNLFCMNLTDTKLSMCESSQMEMENELPLAKSQRQSANPKLHFCVSYRQERPGLEEIQ